MDTDKRVFILGAGFSYHLSGGQFPLGCDLSEILYRLNNRDLNRHFQGCIHSPDNQVEIVLSKLELDRCISESAREDILREVFEEFQKSMLVKDCNPDVIKKSKKLVKRLFGTNDVILTLNYDLLLEHLLSLEDMDMWSPFGNGYGTAIEENSHSVKNADYQKKNQNKKNIKIIKLHGSFNFFQQKYIDCDAFSPSFDVLINDNHPSFFDLEVMFKNMGFTSYYPGHLSKNCDSIVMPTYVKPFAQNYSYVGLWHEAMEEIKEADIITIIGYRFPEEDSMMSFLLSCLSAPSPQGKLRIYILNKRDGCKSVRTNIENVLLANPDNDVDWRDFDLAGNADKAYENLIKRLNSVKK